MPTHISNQSIESYKYREETNGRRYLKEDKNHPDYQEFTFMTVIGVIVFCILIIIFLFGIVGLLCKYILFPMSDFLYN